MTKASSKGPKASVQYVRTIAKRMERAGIRCRDNRAEVKDLWEILYVLMSLFDPELLDYIGISCLTEEPDQKVLWDFSRITNGEEE